MGKLRLREVKQPVQGHEADEMDRALQTPTGSLGGQEDGQTGDPGWLIPSPHLSATVERGHFARDTVAKEEIHAAGSKTPGTVKAGQGWAPSLAPLSASLVALGEQQVFSELNQERSQLGGCWMNLLILRKIQLWLLSGKLLPFYSSVSS